jgi:uncharacterized protein YbaA (DUF1428 family)
MSKYIDGFVLPVPKRNIAAYRRMAAQAGKVWRDHGALDYKECVGDYCLQIPRSSRSGERKSHERQTANDAKEDAIRSQAHALRRIQSFGRRLKRGVDRRDGHSRRFSPSCDGA